MVELLSSSQGSSGVSAPTEAFNHEQSSSDFTYHMKYLPPFADDIQYLVRVTVQRSVSPPCFGQPNGTSAVLRRYIYKSPLRKRSQEHWIPG